MNKTTHTHRGRDVKHVHITTGDEWDERRRTIAGTLPLLDFEYDAGPGGQELFGNVWYTDGNPIVVVSGKCLVTDKHTRVEVPEDEFERWRTRFALIFPT